MSDLLAKLGRPRLLVSVACAEEVPAALAGGADLVDVKDPDRGAMGRPSLATLRAVLSAVADRAPVSVALGELVEWVGRDPSDYPLPEGVSFAKVGLTACDRRAWEPLLAELRRQFDRAAANPLAPPRWVAVAYADQSWARSPAPTAVLDFAAAQGFAGVLLDTWEKNDNRLGDWITRTELHTLVARARELGLLLGLAGSLGEAEIGAVRVMEPDIIGVRAAACGDGSRVGRVSADAVRRLARLLAEPVIELALPDGV